MNQENKSPGSPQLVPVKNEHSSRKLFLKRMLIALGFGLIAMGMILNRFVIPISGLQAELDPRELFVSLGSALTGPAGALLIGFLSGIYHPIPFLNFPVTLMHVAGALFISVYYPKIVIRQKTTLAFLATWNLGILVYYYLIIIPTFMFSTLALPELFRIVFGNLDTKAAFWAIYSSVWIEVLFTMVTSTLALQLLPPYLRRPIHDPA